MQGHWFILTKQIKETVLGLMLFPESQHQATIQNQYGQEKGKENGGGGKVMYKISKINTIFIIDMLQNKVP